MVSSNELTSDSIVPTGRRGRADLEGQQVSLEAKRRRKEMKIMLQLGLILGSFFMGYVPITGVNFDFTFFATCSENIIG